MPRLLTMPKPSADFEPRLCARGSEARLQTFVDIIASLRAPEGCPWDRKQTHASLRRYLVEEAHELADAIDDADDAALCEELGDVLLQLVLHAQIADERGAFTMQHVIDGIAAKMLRRHPHVFDEACVDSPEEVERRWQLAKKAEGKTVLGGVPRSMPALERALRLTERAAGVGFDFPSEAEAVLKVEEELGEWREARAGGDKAQIEAEFGDVLFALVNAARLAGVDPMRALQGTNARFEGRFGFVERALSAEGKHPSDSTLAEMDALWDRAKAHERGEFDD